MKAFYRFSLIVMLLASWTHAEDRSSMSPAALLVGEWLSSDESFTPDPNFPNSREYFSPLVDGVGTRYVLNEQGKLESSPYRVQQEHGRLVEIQIDLGEGKHRKAEYTFNDAGTGASSKFYINEKFAVDTHMAYVGPLMPKSKERPSSGSGKLIIVRVVVNDDTKSNPVDPKTRIWFKGFGSWWLKREMEYGGTFKRLGTRPSGLEQVLNFYRNADDASELLIPYMMTDEMNPDGSHRDSITLDFTDTEIKAYGLPIKAATGKIELKYTR